MILIVAFSSFVFSFVSLYALRRYLTGNKIPSGDAFFHLLISEHVRKNRWKYPVSLENVEFYEGEKRYNYLAYPPIFHYITALFPIRFHLSITKLLNLVILSCISSLTAITVFGLTTNPIVALLSGLLPILSLSVFELSVMFTPRPLGIFFYSVIACIAIFFSYDLSLMLAISVLVALIALTHKFAIQILAFVLLPYSILFNELYLFVGFALGVLIAIISSRGMYLKILREHLSWLYFYSKFPSKAQFTNKLKRILIRNLWYFAILFTAIVLLLRNDQSWLTTDLGTRIAYWAFAPIVIALVVSNRHLSFLGEDYRYVEYGMFPVGLLSVIFFTGSNITVWFAFFVVFLLSFVIMIQYRKHIHRTAQLVDPIDISSYSSLNHFAEDNFLIFPHIRTLEVKYFAQVHVIHSVRPKNVSGLEHLRNLLTGYEIRYILRFKHTDQRHFFELLAGMFRLNRILSFTNFDLYEILAKESCNKS